MRFTRKQSVSAPRTGPWTAPKAAALVEASTPKPKATTDHVISARS